MTAMRPSRMNRRVGTNFLKGGGRMFVSNVIIQYSKLNTTQRTMSVRRNENSIIMR
jgi:hypothetical protein